MAARRGCALWLKSVAIRCELRAVAEKRGYGLRAVSCGSKVGPRAMSCGCKARMCAVAEKHGYKL